MEYTPGKWKAKRNALGTWTIQTDLEPIGQIDSHHNANLIAAAPMMYEALKAALPALQGILDEHDNRPKHIKDRINMIVEALASAEGRS